MRVQQGLLIFSFLILSQHVFACSCTDPGTVKESFKNSDAVFSGTIISSEIISVFDSLEIEKMKQDGSVHSVYLGQQIRKYVVVTDHIYKGNFTTDTLTLYTGLGGGDCGLRFTSGSRILIYGYDHAYFGGDHYPMGKNIIWSMICTRSGSFQQEEADELNELTD